jgi:hypothetical protein
MRKTPRSAFRESRHHPSIFSRLAASAEGETVVKKWTSLRKDSCSNTRLP